MTKPKTKSKKDALPTFGNPPEASVAAVTVERALRAFVTAFEAETNGVVPYETLQAFDVALSALYDEEILLPEDTLDNLREQVKGMEYDVDDAQRDADELRGEVEELQDVLEDLRRELDALRAQAVAS